MPAINFNQPLRKVLVDIINTQYGLTINADTASIGFPTPLTEGEFNSEIVIDGQSYQYNRIDLAEFFRGKPILIPYPGAQHSDSLQTWAHIDKINAATGLQFGMNYFENDPGMAISDLEFTMASILMGDMTYIGPPGSSTLTLTASATNRVFTGSVVAYQVWSDPAVDEVGTVGILHIGQSIAVNIYPLPENGPMAGGSPILLPDTRAFEITHSQFPHVLNDPRTMEYWAFFADFNRPPVLELPDQFPYTLRFMPRPLTEGVIIDIPLQGYRLTREPLWYNDSVYFAMLGSAPQEGWEYHTLDHEVQGLDTNNNEKLKSQNWFCRAFYDRRRRKVVVERLLAFQDACDYVVVGSDMYVYIYEPVTYNRVIYRSVDGANFEKLPVGAIGNDLSFEIGAAVVGNKIVQRVSDVSSSVLARFEVFDTTTVSSEYIFGHVENWPVANRPVPTESLNPTPTLFAVDGRLMLYGDLAATGAGFEDIPQLQGIVAEVDIDTGAITPIVDFFTPESPTTPVTVLQTALLSLVRPYVYKTRYNGTEVTCVAIFGFALGEVNNNALISYDGGQTFKLTNSPVGPPPMSNMFNPITCLYRCDYRPRKSKGYSVPYALADEITVVSQGSLIVAQSIE